ncbi:hypothetical protein [Amycolatopsis sacchari]|uniref:hypothetical protein n=1 Tax=Amycolatopsis sacchari TaxID=115433 RepID=UPI003D72D8C1
MSADRPGEHHPDDAKAGNQREQEAADEVRTETGSRFPPPANDLTAARLELLETLFGRVRAEAASDNPLSDEARFKALTEDRLAVIGSLESVKQVREWVSQDEPGSQNLEVIDGRDWTVTKNDTWVQAQIDQGLPAWMMDNLTTDGLWKPHHEDPGKPQERILLHEFHQFVGAGYRIDGNLLVPPERPAENPEAERHFVGMRFTRETAEPVFVRRGPEGEDPPAGPACYVGGWSERTPTVPAELFERYQRLDNAHWSVGESVMRELFGATAAGWQPHLAGMSEEEEGQRSGPEWGTEWAKDWENPAQAGFLPYFGRVPDGVSSQDSGLLEVKHYRLFDQGVGVEVQLSDHIGRQLIHDYLAQNPPEGEGERTTWVFSGAPPSAELAGQLYELDLDYVVLAPRHRDLQSGEGPTVAWLNYARWNEHNAQQLKELRER